jgi:hypothetical protein
VVNEPWADRVKFWDSLNLLELERETEAGLLEKINEKDEL